MRVSRQQMEKARIEIIPMIGDQTIEFGDAQDHEEKFNKLRLFYKKGLESQKFQTFGIAGSTTF